MSNCVGGPAWSIEGDLAQFADDGGQCLEDSGIPSNTVVKNPARVSVAGNIARFVDGSGTVIEDSGIPAGGGGSGGLGDVVGPASAVDGHLAIFDGVTGKLIADSGVDLSDVARKSIANVFTALGNRFEQDLGFGVLTDIHYRLAIDPVTHQLTVEAYDGTGTLLTVPIKINSNGTVDFISDITIARDAIIGRDVRATGSIYEQGRTTAMGYWKDVAFNAGHYTANGGSTWTVTAGQVLINHYTIIGKTLLWNLTLTAGTVIGGADSLAIYVQIPDGLLAAKPNDGVSWYGGFTGEVRIYDSFRVVLHSTSGPPGYLVGAQGDIPFSMQFELA